MISLINDVDFNSLSGNIGQTGRNILNIFSGYTGYINANPSGFLNNISGLNHSTLVHTTGNESISGKKTFFNNVECSGTGIFGRKMSTSVSPTYDNISVGVRINGTDIVGTGAWITVPDRGGMAWADAGAIWGWSNHSANGGELQINGSPNIGIQEGSVSSPAGVQLGASLPSHARWFLQFDNTAELTTGIGWSKVFAWTARSYDASRGYLYNYPGIMSWTYNTGYDSVDSFLDHSIGGAELRFYSESPRWATVLTEVPPDNYSGLEIGRANCDKWRFNSVLSQGNIDALQFVRTSGFVASGKPPAAFNSPGTSGQIAVGSPYLYVCTGNSLWGRVALSPW